LFMEHRLFAFPLILGSLVALLAGCGTFTSHQSLSEESSARSDQSKNKTQAIAAPEQDASLASASAPKWELPIPEHRSIECWTRRFSTEKHTSFQVQLDRACPYAVPAQQIFEQRGLPKDLIYVALVESGFTPKARSHAKAVGMWQFIPATGKRFGLEQNKWVDERCHPMKAARAAADYLSFLYDTFGSWPLALAAYNAGEKAVQGALDQSGLKTFWDLSDHGYLPFETRDYVPKVLAAVTIIRDPKHYGFHLTSEHYVKKHETVPIRGGVKLSWIEKKIGLPEASLQDCNPELCRPETPPGCSNYELCVPVGKGDDLLAALAESPVQEETPQKKALAAPPKPLLSYEARPGDSWLGLSRKYKCSARDLAALNGMTLSDTLKVRQTIKIPAEESPMAAAAVQARENTTAIQAKEDKVKPSQSNVDPRKSPSSGQKLTMSSQGAPMGKGDDHLAAPAESPVQQEKPQKKALTAPPKSLLSYEAKPGDSWLSLARKYKCSAKDLTALNGMTLSDTLKVRQTIKIPAGELPMVAAVIQTKENKAAIQTTENKAKPSQSNVDARKPSSSEQKLSTSIQYPVRRGDTLYSIADKFGISVKALCAQNELTEKEKLIPGNLLTIHVNRKDSVLCYKKSTR